MYVCTIAYRVQYTFTRVHARIPNGHPREDARAEVGEDVRVGVRVGPMEFQRYCTWQVGGGRYYECKIDAESANRR